MRTSLIYDCFPRILHIFYNQTLPIEITKTVQSQVRCERGCKQRLWVKGCPATLFPLPPELPSLQYRRKSFAPYADANATA